MQKYFNQSFFNYLANKNITEKNCGMMSLDLSKRFNYKQCQKMASSIAKNKGRNSPNIAECKKLPLVASVNTTGISDALPKDLSQQQKIGLLYKQKYLGTHRKISAVKDKQQYLHHIKANESYQFFSSPQLSKKPQFVKVNFDEQSKERLSGQNSRTNTRVRNFLSKNYQPIRRRPEVVVIYNIKQEHSRPNLNLTHARKQSEDVPKATWIDKMKVKSKSNQKKIVNPQYSAKKQQAYKDKKVLRKLVKDSQSRYSDGSNQEQQPKKRLSMRRFQRKNLENRALVRIIQRNVVDERQKSQEIKKRFLQSKMTRNQSPIRRAYSIIMNTKRKLKKSSQLKSAVSSSLSNTNNQFTKTVKQNRYKNTEFQNGQLMMKFYATQYVSKKSQKLDGKDRLFDPKKWNRSGSNENAGMLSYVSKKKIAENSKQLRKGSVDLGKLQIDPW